MKEFRLIKGSRDQETRSLVVRSRPKSDESFFGFLLRLTELNAYTSHGLIPKLARLDEKVFLCNHIWEEHNSKYDGLIQLTKITRNDLKQLLYTPATKRSGVMIFGQSVPYSLMGAPRPKVCHNWDRQYRTAQWLRTKRTGQYVTKMATQQILKVDLPVIDQLISSGMLRGVIRATGKRRDFILEAESVERLRQEWAQSVSLPHASKYLGIRPPQTLMLVRHSLLTGTNILSGDSGQLWRFDMAQLDKLLSNVFARAKRVRSVSVDLMWRFRSLVDALCISLVSTSWGIHTLIEDILTGVIVPQCRYIKKPTLNDLYFSRDEIKRYIRTKLDEQSTEPIRLAEGTTERLFKSSTLYFLAQKGFIKTERSSVQGVQCHVITAKAILAFKSHYVGADELLREIRTSGASLVRALKYRKVFPVSGRSVDGGPLYIYKREDVLHLKLKKKGSHIVDSREAAEILSVKKKAVVQLVKNGVLIPYSEPPERAGEYHFNRSLIERFVGRFTDLTNLISPTVAAKILQINPSSISCQWIKNGYLKYQISRDRKKRFLVRSEVEHIASFMNSIVTRPEAAIMLGVSREYIKTILRRERLKPINNPYPLAFPHIIYSRSDFETLRRYYRDAGRNANGVRGTFSIRKQNLLLASRLPVTQ